MMRWIVGVSLKFRLLVVALATATLVVGVSQLRDMPVDVLPEFVPPTVEIQTEALGLSATEVEQLITVPMEQDLLVGVAFLVDIRSRALPGLSAILPGFAPGTHPYRAPFRSFMTGAPERARGRGRARSRRPGPGRRRRPRPRDPHRARGHAARAVPTREPGAARSGR